MFSKIVHKVVSQPSSPFSSVVVYKTLHGMEVNVQVFNLLLSQKNRYLMARSVESIKHIPKLKLIRASFHAPSIEKCANPFQKLQLKRLLRLFELSCCWVEIQILSCASQALRIHSQWLTVNIWVNKQPTECVLVMRANRNTTQYWLIVIELNSNNTQYLAAHFESKDSNWKCFDSVSNELNIFVPS